MSPILYCFIAFTGGVGLLLVLQKKRRASMLPPGPPGDPLVGHLLRMPSANSALVFHQWAKTYGDVMRLEVLGRTMIILDSYQAAVDLLEKRGAIYSDRPKFTLYGLLGWDPSLTFLQYGKQFNKHRTMHQSYLNRHKVEEFKPFQTQEARTLVQNLFESPPDKYEKCMGRQQLDRFATGIIAQIVAGHRITSNDDPYLRISGMLVEAMSKTGLPGSSPETHLVIVQHFPPWFPGAGHVGVVRSWRSVLQELHEYPLRSVRKQKVTGEAMPSFILTQLERMDGTEEDVDLKGAAATIRLIWDSQTWGAVSIFFLAMILHPEYQVKAQKEIDSVVGDQRLPDFEDRGNLPLVECILQESLRWKSGVPLGRAPHRVCEDDIYRGMLIPKGSLVFANVRGMSLNESVYSDPTSFYPERFLPKPAGKGESYFSNAVFGFGRRICAGQYVAENSLWIAIASILASCKIENAVDKSGNVIVTDPTFTDGLVRSVSWLRGMVSLSQTELISRHPKDTRCIVSPRSSGAKTLIFGTQV
ncbi:cytochrome P450 [Mycena capillaripes]|nr:cytochrome P450 [Mycena capillaripes]